MAGVIASSSGQADTTLNNLATSDRADAAAQDLASSTSTMDNSVTSASNEVNEQAGSDNFGIDTDQMAMRLALDVLWTGGGPGVTKPAIPASEKAVSDVL